jgi:hypothetical protein
MRVVKHSSIVILTWYVSFVVQQVGVFFALEASIHPVILTWYVSFVVQLRLSQKPTMLTVNWWW